MDRYSATEQAYKNGYKQGKQDAVKWIPVSEPPKEPGIYQVFGYDKDWEKTKVWYGQFSGYDWFVYNIYGDGMRFDVTHWMPLPQPPKEETKTNFGISQRTVQALEQMGQKVHGVKGE
jgi:hypothetical protein